MVSEIGASTIYNVSEHAEVIKKQVGSKKTQIVIDEVRQNALSDHPEWFIPGSKTMITVSKLHLLNANGASTVKFQVRAQYVDKPAELFRHRALNQSVMEATSLKRFHFS